MPNIQKNLTPQPNTAKELNTEFYKQFDEIFYLQILNHHLRIYIQYDNGFITRIKIDLADKRENFSPSPIAHKFKKIIEGKLNKSSIPFCAKGTIFQKRIWTAACHIPFGEIKSYSEIANEVECGSPRAVGQALKANPLPIIIPCHRVIGKTGNLVGFSCGLEIKALLLQFEANQPLNS
jgi:O-6-methylguanine DNA methyltransferase